MQKRAPGFEDAEADAPAVTLVAGPFTTAERLRGFVRAVEALPAMCEVCILALKQQWLSLLLLDADATSLLERLLTLADFPFDVEEEQPEAITLLPHDPPAVSP